MNCSVTRPFSLLLPCLALAATLATAVAVPTHAATLDPPKGFMAQATPMPTFELTGIDGSKVRTADLRDKVTVIRFWATW